MFDNSFEQNHIYKYLSQKKGLKYLGSVASLLYIPSVFLSMYFFIFRWDQAKYLDWTFACCTIIASMWFLCGPHLICKFIKYFLMLSSSDDINPQSKKYFALNKIKQYKDFKLYLLISFLLCSVLVVGGIILHPEILSNHITYGLSDPLFYAIVLFLLYFLYYASYACAFIILFARMVIGNYRKDYFGYTPIKYKSYLTMKRISFVLSKIVLYTCSGMLFLPFAWYYIFQESIYSFWAFCLLMIYSVFLIIAVILPKIAMNLYIRKITQEYILTEREKIFNGFHKNYKNASNFLYEADMHMTYVRQIELCASSCYLSNISELNSNNKISYFDFQAVITYVSASCTIMATILPFLV